MGIGAMGEPMARRLLEAGYDTAVWNRTRSKADHLAELGATVFDDAVDAAASAEVVVTILETGDAVEAVLFDQGVAEALTQGASVIDMSSISANVARNHALRLSHRGVGYLDAPLSGGTRGAAEGSLAIMVGGDPAEFDRRREILAVFGNPTLVGPSGSGQVTKLANQMIVGITIGAVAEAITLVIEAGVDPNLAIAALDGGFADSRILREHGARMIESEFELGAASRVQVKDLVNALGAAKEMNLNLPVTTLIHALFESLCSHGGSELDHSALVLEIRGHGE